jgi:hypothetical protein
VSLKLCVFFVTKCISSRNHTVILTNIGIKTNLQKSTCVWRSQSIMLLAHKWTSKASFNRYFIIFILWQLRHDVASLMSFIILPTRGSCKIKSEALIEDFKDWFYNWSIISKVKWTSSHKVVSNKTIWKYYNKPNQ